METKNYENKNAMKRIFNGLFKRTTQTFFLVVFFSAYVGLESDSRKLEIALNKLKKSCD